ncbi:hypothetical protein [Bacillus sp. EAC]|uniref:hypothetical protein n=1 Tax=Bacillus sp. EAC TaxID=1978338 RepID=UPI000B44CB64|nr:hypothetical protein [Bacillus sp. EAC]
MLVNWIRNKNERKLIYLAFIVSFIIFIAGWWTIEHRSALSTNVQSHLQNGYNHLKEFNPLKSYAKSKGSLGRLGVFTAFAIFPIYFLLRVNKLNNKKELKKSLAKVLKWVKLLHVPISLITFALITVHSIVMTFYEWKTNAVYISGVIAYLLLLPLGIFGFLRYKRKDKNWHYYLSFAVVISMLIHTFI